MTNPTVTFTGAEVALLAGLVCGTLHMMEGDDFEVADFLLERMLAALPRPMSPELVAIVEAKRLRPIDRFQKRIAAFVGPLGKFGVIDAAVIAKVSPASALSFLKELAGMERAREHSPNQWTLEEPKT